MEQSLEIKDLATALSKAQAEIKAAVKDSTNPFFKSKYADLSSVWEACRISITKNGLSVIQTGRSDFDLVIVTTQLQHSSGQWVRGEFSAKPVKNDPQAIGSCITYLRRYSLAAMVGVAPEDDDANDATKPAAKPAPVTISNHDYSKCPVGENKGIAWEKMNLKQLQFYKALFEREITNPKTATDIVKGCLSYVNNLLIQHQNQ